MTGKSKRARSSAQSRSKSRKVPHNSKRPSPKSSAQLGKGYKQPKLGLTATLKKPGPKEKIPASEVVNRAHDLRLTFQIAGKQLDWAKVLAAQSIEDVVAAFGAMRDDYRRKFLYKPELILQCLRDPQFPRRDREAQERFIAESLAGDGRISIRRSRDICGEERTRSKGQGRILRREFYIVCSCGYKGPARYDACPKCLAQISYLDSALGITIGT